MVVPCLTAHLRTRELSTLARYGSCRYACVRSTGNTALISTHTKGKPCATRWFPKGNKGEVTRSAWLRSLYKHWYLTHRQKTHRASVPIHTIAQGQLGLL